MTPIESDLNGGDRGLLIDALRMYLDELTVQRLSDLVHGDTYDGRERLQALELLESLKEADVIRLIKE